MPQLRRTRGSPEIGRGGTLIKLAAPSPGAAARASMWRPLALNDRLIVGEQTVLGRQDLGAMRHHHWYPLEALSEGHLL